MSWEEDIKDFRQRHDAGHATASVSTEFSCWDAKLSAAIKTVFDKLMAMDTEEFHRLMDECEKADPARAEAIRRGMVVD